nr:carbohydrate kinase family protein [Cohnella zeiphila]
MDIIPSMQGGGSAQGLSEMLVPGKLVEVGSALLSTGGAVSNTGLALHRLGFPVTLMGKVGDDPFGRLVLDLLKGHGDGLADGMIVASGESSSYSVVLSPPGVDRVFLHCTGANDTFAADDMPAGSLAGAKLFHFGYPPLMARMYADGGAELERLLSKVKEQGLTVSLDMARPDPASPAGRADWPAILARVLPWVDIFLPSFEEILFMLRPDRYRELAKRHGADDLLICADGPLLDSLSEQLLGMGAAVVGLKLGARGFYLRTTADPERLRRIGLCAPDGNRLADWLDRELLAPCYRVEAVGTTGAGDCTIAGFLGGLAQGLPIEEALLGAVGVGACSVERADAVSGVRSWREVRERIGAGWQQSEDVPSLPGWERASGFGIWEHKRALG